MSPNISILHATYRSQSGPLKVKEAWLRNAERPDLIEYIFAMDADDEAALSQTEGDLRVVNPPSDVRVTAVRNWNAAASIANSGLLMVIADDLFPPPAWDATLTAMIGPIDPAVASFALKVTDSPFQDDTLLRHPVVSRAFYQRYGLFSNAYDGVYSDNDITIRAFWQSVILDGRSLVLEHQHPELDTSMAWSESQQRINTPQEYERGRAVFEASWTHRQRLAKIRLAPAAPGAQLSESRLRARQRRYRAWEIIAYPCRGAKWTLARLLLPENRSER
jgi:hypothetical protein